MNGAILQMNDAFGWRFQRENHRHVGLNEARDGAGIQYKIRMPLQSISDRKPVNGISGYRGKALPISFGRGSSHFGSSLHPTSVRRFYEKSWGTST
jgi:hypothetical protein